MASTLKKTARSIGVIVSGTNATSSVTGRRMENDVPTAGFVWMVIDRNINLALEFLSRLPEGVGLDGQPPECNANTRKGTPCQRRPLPGRDYCPSHKHLEETFEGVELPLQTLDRELQQLAAA